MKNTDLEKIRKEAQEKAEKEFQKEREKFQLEAGIPEGYKCVGCGNNVRFNFPLEFLKQASLCPDCYWKENESSS